MAEVKPEQKQQVGESARAALSGRPKRTGRDRRIRPLQLPPLPAEKDWLWVEEGFDPVREHEIESLLTVANGYVGTRGSLPERTSLSLPGTFVAGVFDTPPHSVPELVVGPDWVGIRVFVEGEEIEISHGTVLEHRRWLDLRRGLLRRDWLHRDSAGRVTRISFERFASLADSHVLMESVTIVPENYGGRIAVQSTVDGKVANWETGVRLGPAEISTLPLTPGSPSDSGTPAEIAVLTVRTLDSGITLAFTLNTNLQESDDTPAEMFPIVEEGLIGQRWEWPAQIGLTYRLDKLVTVYTSRDTRTPGKEAADHLALLLKQGVGAVLKGHEKAWARRWQSADVEIASDPEAQLAARFAIFHLTAAANPRDEFISVGARLLTGEIYKGHVFWDTEIYMLPFYVFAYPEAARSLLMYRYHTLPKARDKARAMGYRGALYPWEAAMGGEEAAPSAVISPTGEVLPILSGAQEHHISADIAYAVWQYWQATADDEFLCEAGAEILVETARFWASRVSRETDGLYHIRKVIGPDEYHETVDDDVYTNLLAQWNLERGAETVQMLKERWPANWQKLADRLQIRVEEPEEWRAMAERMYTGFNPATGIFEQFQGYFDLETIDLAAFEPRAVPMDVLLGHEHVEQTQVIKQPDVVMAIYLLWDRFKPEVREANFRYYTARCGMGSSLAPSINAAVAARLADLPFAARSFRQAAEIDLANNMGNAAGGIHAAALGGLWQAMILGFAGMRLRPDGITLDPHPLREWQALHFPVEWRKRRLGITIRGSPPTLEVVLAEGHPMRIYLGAETGFGTVIEAGKRYRAVLANGAWGPLKEVT